MATGGAQAGDRWVARKGAALALKAVVLLGPAALAIGVSSLASHLLTAPKAIGPKLVWLAALGATSTALLVVADRQLRRLLPLAALLRLSLAFPDRAPSRFRSAMRMGSARTLEQRLHDAQSGGRPGESADDAALRIIELATALRTHDRRTRGHSERVRVYADMLGQELGLPQHERDKLHWAALLHDIGKLEVPGAILNKKGRPSEDEWAVLQAHPLAGRQLLAPLLDWLGPWAAAAWEHHERWDGDGYPMGLGGTEISLSGRIVAVADAFEVMTAVRSYKKAMSPGEARAELTKCAGTHFDPSVVRAMLTISVGRLRAVMGPITWFAQLPLLGWGSPATMPAAVGTTVSSLGRTIVLASALHSVAPATVSSLGPMVEISSSPAPTAGHSPTAVRTTGATTGDGATPVSGSRGPVRTPGGEAHRDGTTSTSTAADPSTGVSPTTVAVVASDPGPVTAAGEPAGSTASGSGPDASTTAPAQDAPPAPEAPVATPPAHPEPSTTTSPTAPPTTAQPALPAPTAAPATTAHPAPPAPPATTARPGPPANPGPPAHPDPPGPPKK